MIKSLESKETNQEDYKKVKFILSLQTILLIILSIIFICIFKSYNMTARYIIIILIFIVRFISDKLIKAILKINK
jgi:putative flippase GtrA